jgi:hypothetical protein
MFVVNLLCTVEVDYNDIGSCDVVAIASDRYSVVANMSSLLTITLYSSVRTPLVYNDRKCSVPFMML